MQSNSGNRMHGMVDLKLDRFAVMRGQQNQTRVPAPIFSKKKPRQALFAHPNNINRQGNYSTGSVPNNREGHGAGPSEARTYNMATGYRSAFPRPAMACNQKTPGASLHAVSPAPTGTRLTTHTDTLTSTRARFAPPTTSYRNVEDNADGFGESSYNMSSGPGYQPYTSQRCLTNKEPNHDYMKTCRHAPSSVAPTVASHGGGAINAQSGSHRPRMQQPSASGTALVPRNHNLSGPRYGLPGPSSPHFGRQAWGNPDLPPQIHHQGPGWDMTSESHYTAQTETPSRHPSALQDVTNTYKTTCQVQGNNRQKIDNSLHFITATVQGMKHWAQYNDRLTLMFEVFGMLNSAVTTNKDRGCIEFVLKLDNDTVNCVFYHIDRELPRLTRGQWYRCVGKLSLSGTTMNCISVRPARQEESTVFKQLVTLSDRTLRQQVSKIN